MTKKIVLACAIGSMGFLSTFGFSTKYILKLNKSMSAIAGAKALQNGGEYLPHLDMVIMDSKNFSPIAALSGGNQAVTRVEVERIHPAPQAVANEELESEEENSELTWGLNAIKAPEAWKSHARGDGVKVFVLDTGIDRDHPDLKDNFVKGEDFVSFFGAIPFFNLSTELSTAWMDAGKQNKVAYDYFDDIGHGTHVAGTIAAVENKEGVIGVAPEAKIYAARVCGFFGCPTTAIVRAINWAIENNADVMNLSLGSQSSSELEKQALEAAHKAGITVIAASGNDHENFPKSISYPARFESTISVGATMPNNERAPFSQHSDDLDIVAPGFAVNSSIPVGTGRDTSFSLSANNQTIELIATLMHLSGLAEDSIDQPIVHVGDGLKDDIEELENIAGNVWLVSNLKSSLADKVTIAEKNGASALIVYNDRNELFIDSVGFQASIPVLGIPQGLGEQIIAILDTDLELNGIVSVVRTNHEYNHGTSMAAPHVAGVAALLKGVNPDLEPDDIRKILKNTAKPLTNEDKNTEFGAGLVDAARAVNVAKVHQKNNFNNGFTKTQKPSFGNFAALSNSFSIPKSINIR